MADPTIPAIARVECRSEGRGDETPVAISFADQRVPIVDIIDRAVVTGVEAGGPVRHRFWVELEDGRRCELTRAEPGGEWRVKVEA